MTRRFDYFSVVLVAGIAIALLAASIFAFRLLPRSIAGDGSWAGDAVIAWLHPPWVFAPAAVFTAAIFVIGGLAGRTSATPR
jgi:hypothetical protein